MPRSLQRQAPPKIKRMRAIQKCTKSKRATNGISVSKRTLVPALLGSQEEKVGADAGHVGVEKSEGCLWLNFVFISTGIFTRE